MPTTLRPASDADISTILGWTHTLWGGSRTLDAYNQFTRGLLATQWGRERFRFIVGVDAVGEAVCACKRYTFDIWRGPNAATAVGFGAVFTRPEARGRGHAAAMLRGLMDQARSEGVAVALLYSDIGAAYYEKLGFQVLGGFEAAAPGLSGASDFRAFTPQDASLLPRWWQSMTTHPEFAAFRYGRDERYWHYLGARVGTTTWIYAPGDGAEMGYLAGRMSQGVLSVQEAGWDASVDETTFWKAVRAHATAIGGPLASVTGWLPMQAEHAGFVLAPVTDGIPMLAALDGLQRPQGVALWGHDHF
jgi:GNAT superfamily N-acetyltransferase